MASEADRPFIKDDRLFCGLLRDMANGEAQIVMDQSDQRMHQVVRTGKK